MKRIVSVVLVLLVILSNISIASAKNANSASGKENSYNQSNGEQSNAKANQAKSNVDILNRNMPVNASKGLEKANEVKPNINTNTKTNTKTNTTQRVLVIFKEKVNKQSIEQVKGKVTREYRNIPVLSVEIPVQARKGLEKNPNVAFVEEDVQVQLQTQTQDWGIARTKAQEAWDLNYTGKGIKVSVIDTGIANHEDIIIAGGTAFTSYTTSYLDDNGHGTHVAGIIGARNNGYGTVGIAPESSLYAVKVLDKNGSGYLSDVIAGIDWSITNKMDIINMSLGSTTDSSTLKNIVDKAYSQGIIVVAAAGNTGNVDGTGDNVNYPARYETVIAVAATNAKDQRAAFSSTGNTVEVSAPGVKIISTYLNNQYAYMDGTSMASPYAAGNLALLKQAHPTLTNSELRKKLQELSIDLGVSGKDTSYGYGLIQAPKKIESEPTVTQPQVLDTTTSVITNKQTYVAGEKVYITTSVVDHQGNGIMNAEVKLVIKPPKGKMIYSSGKTNDKGQITIVYTTKRTTVKGSYQVTADSSHSNYKSSNGSASFQIK